MEGVGNAVENQEQAALYTAGPPPEKLLRELQQQLTRLFAAKPSEKYPVMMGMFAIFHKSNILY